MPTHVDMRVKDRTLVGMDAILDQIRSWQDAGVVTADVYRAVDGLSDELDLRSSDFVFVVMGAGAAMGPLHTLLSLGAHVIALDLPRPSIWRRLISTARESPGTLTFPTRASPQGSVPLCSSAGK
jgi:hypothetical protein